MKLTTLSYFVQDGQVLLAMKKRGFGMGKWNGPGGKVKDISPEGYIGLQNHDSQSPPYFRNVYLKEL